MCGRCGGPKPKGRGRRFCEACSPHCEQHTTMTGGCVPCRKAFYEANPGARERTNERNYRNRLKREYGLSPEQIEQVLGTKSCETCGQEGKMVVDHDHETGKFRGVLCDLCNKTLGMARDNPETLRALADYLDRIAYFKGGRL